MSQWVEPKTNWEKSDYFNLDPDYIRIKGNITYLYEMASDLYGAFSILPMGEYTIADIPHADFFNTIEENMQRLADDHYLPNGFGGRKYFYGNGRPWTHEDLNRIEQNLLLLYRAFSSQNAGKQELPYDLGREIRI
jgi:hypothetical protein